MADLISCPNCGSDNCQSYEVIHAHGTSQINTTINTGGVGVVGGRLGFGAAKSKVSGVQQSAMGAYTSPPPKKRLKGKLIATAVFLFISLMGLHGNVLMALPYFVIAVALGYWVYRSVKYNNTTWVKLYDEWRQKWLCNKCGTTFIPLAQAEIAATTEQK